MTLRCLSAPFGGEKLMLVSYDEVVRFSDILMYVQTTTFGNFYLEDIKAVTRPKMQSGLV